MDKSFFEKYKTSEVTNTRRVINTPPAFTREHFFYIQEAGYLQSLKPHLSRRNALRSYLFLIVLSGSGEISYRPPHTADTPLKSSRQGDPADADMPEHRGKKEPLTTVSARTGDCFFLDCMGTYTHISSASDPWELLWIHFYGPQADAYYSRFSDQHAWHFTSTHLPELTDAIWSIIHLHEEKTDDTDLLAAQQIVHILTAICTKPETQSTDARSASVSALDDKLKNIIRYLDDHYTENISLDQLAEHFFISKYYLSREFKKEFGTTIIQYVLTKKITNAKELLRYSSSSIEEIAQLCGIDDASYFNKVFKKLEGCTASEYRRRW